MIFCLLLLGTGALVGGGWWIWQRPGPLEAGRDVVVPHGDTLTVWHGLAAAGVVQDDDLARMVFRATIWLTRRDGALHAAELAFPAHVSLAKVVWVLRHAPPVQHYLTIPEGWTAWRIAAQLKATDTLTGETPPIPEGSVLPQTIAFLRGTPRATVVRRLQHMMDGALARVWAGRDASLTLPDAHALLVLASIVERETGRPAERPQVARVFLNRLAQGMRLQSDPTVIYDLSEGTGAIDHPLTRAELDESGPENTYRIAGLPPAPICSPGLATLEAVAHPASGDALYFVATGTGGHRFAATLDEHNRNVAAYRKSGKDGR
ncbi:endolytic transglycosylase MltG [Acidomonas methanolica]|uniref:endolytic transglycosylase MltG n=1 Tax=Acidomonas methanolica TaxID=437 RepID=UPI00351D8E00